MEKFHCYKPKQVVPQKDPRHCQKAIVFCQGRIRKTDLVFIQAKYRHVICSCKSFPHRLLYSEFFPVQGAQSFDPFYQRDSKIKRDKSISRIRKGIPHFFQT
jgi:hypothetical protein